MMCKSFQSINIAYIISFLDVLCYDFVVEIYKYFFSNWYKLHILCVSNWDKLHVLSFSNWDKLHVLLFLSLDKLHVLPLPEVINDD